MDEISEVRVECTNEDCKKLFAMLKAGNIYLSPSTDMDKIQDQLEQTDVQIEIKCNKCKRKSNIIVKQMFK